MKIFFAMAAVAVLSGCSSVYSSIEPAVEADTYYVTETSVNPFGVFGDLLLCKAEGVTKMVCESVD